MLNYQRVSHSIWNSDLRLLHALLPKDRRKSSVPGFQTCTQAWDQANNPKCKGCNKLLKRWLSCSIPYGPYATTYANHLTLYLYIYINILESYIYWSHPLLEHVQDQSIQFSPSCWFVWENPPAPLTALSANPLSPRGSSAPAAAAAGTVPVSAATVAPPGGRRTAPVAAPMAPAPAPGAQPCSWPWWHRPWAVAGRNRRPSPRHRGVPAVGPGRRRGPRHLSPGKKGLV